MTTIKVSTMTRDRLKNLADQDRLTLDAELARTLDRAEEDRFWEGSGPTTPGSRPTPRSGGATSANWPSGITPQVTGWATGERAAARRGRLT